MSPRRLPGWEWAVVLFLVLLGWGLRVWRPAEVPPGWRDDEMINIHALTGKVLAGRPTIYFTGASGHEPLYHTLHAGVLALVGMNPLGGHLLSILSGTLTIPLTYVLGRRLFGRAVGLAAAALVATSFWSLMYSRFALRHAMVLPPALALFYLLWSNRPRSVRLRPLAWGLLLAFALYTYTVSRLIPPLLVAFGLYLAVFHRWLGRTVKNAKKSESPLRPLRFTRWRPVLAALAVALVLTLPLWIAIARGRSEAAAQGIGADARIAELAVPLRELRAGNPRPLLENARTTLGMFHATGDPEWLYNLPGRPVFGPVGAAFFFIGLGLALWRWRRPEYGFLLLWLVVGISPALVTLPPSSLGHTILAQPAVYLLAALPLKWVSGAQRRSSNVKRLLLPASCLLLLASSVRDLRDYFVAWPAQEMVRFLYRADYRGAARYLDAHPEVVDVAVGSTLMGPWDRLALADDLRRDDVRARLFNPERALLLPAGAAPQLVLTLYPDPAPALEPYIEGPPVWARGELRVYRAPTDLPQPGDGPTAPFANGLDLEGIAWAEGEPAPGQEIEVWLAWRVARPLDLPPIPVVANPPPPGVYSGPRLAVFTHLLAADGTFVVGDDGLWADPLTLRPGDRLFQMHRFDVPPDAPPGPYQLEVGLYDPMTGERWMVVDRDGRPVTDRLLLPLTGS